MKTVLNKEMVPPEIHYFEPNEVIEQKEKNSLFRFIFNVCLLLNIDVPNVAIGTVMPSFNPETGELSERMATTWTPEELSGIDKPLIYIGVAYPDETPLNDDILLSGVVAHELRHLWQQKYHADDYAETSKGFSDSIYNVAEIDADAFAFVFVSNGVDMENVGQHICKQEYEMFPDAFSLRMERAEKILSDIKGSSKTMRKKPFRERIRSLLRRK